MQNVSLQRQELVQRGVLVELDRAVTILVKDTNQLASRLEAEGKPAERALSNFVGSNGTGSVSVNGREPSLNLLFEQDVRDFFSFLLFFFFFFFFCPSFAITGHS